MIDVQPYIDKLHLLSIYMENKIWCIGRQPFQYSFEYWFEEINKGRVGKPIEYWINKNN